MSKEQIDCSILFKASLTIQHLMNELCSNKDSYSLEVLENYNSLLKRTAETLDDNSSGLNIEPVDLTDKELEIVKYNIFSALAYVRKRYNPSVDYSAIDEANKILLSFGRYYDNQEHNLFKVEQAKPNANVVSTKKFLLDSLKQYQEHSNKTILEALGDKIHSYLALFDQIQIKQNRYPLERAENIYAASLCIISQLRKYEIKSLPATPQRGNHENYNAILAELAEWCYAQILKNELPENDANKDRLPLSENEAAVYELLKSLPENKAMTGKDIITTLEKKKDVIIDQSTLTKNIMPFLKKHYGVQNRRGAGYYIVK